MGEGKPQLAWPPGSQAWRSLQLCPPRGRPGPREACVRLCRSPQGASGTPPRSPGATGGGLGSSQGEAEWAGAARSGASCALLPVSLLLCSPASAWPPAPTSLYTGTCAPPSPSSPFSPELPLPRKALARPAASSGGPAAPRLSLTHQRGLWRLPELRAGVGGTTMGQPARAQPSAHAPVPRPVPKTRLFGLPGLRQAPEVSRCGPWQGHSPGGCKPAAITTEVPESSQVRMEGWCVCVDAHSWECVHTHGDCVYSGIMCVHTGLCAHGENVHGDCVCAHMGMFVYTRGLCVFAHGDCSCGRESGTHRVCVLMGVLCVYCGIVCVCACTRLCVYMGIVCVCTRRCECVRGECVCTHGGVCAHGDCACTWDCVCAHGECVCAHGDCVCAWGGFCVYSVVCVQMGIVGITGLCVYTWGLCVHTEMVLCAQETVCVHMGVFVYTWRLLICAPGD